MEPHGNTAKRQASACFLRAPANIPLNASPLPIAGTYAAEKTTSQLIINVLAPPLQLFSPNPLFFLGEVIVTGTSKEHRLDNPNYRIIGVRSSELTKTKKNHCQLKQLIDIDNY